MDVVNCRNCGRLFNRLSRERLCPACRRAEEDKFQEVKTYLTEHPNASVDEVSRENEVSVKQIKQWVREERLAFTEGSIEGLQCESCGKMIRTGRFCDECKINMINHLNDGFEHPKKAEETKKKPARDGDRMRFLKNNQ